ncbi:MAG: YceH family protein [Opitutaceae bacterium]
MDDSLPPLSAEEVRVLGALIEKQVTTPDYYPLTLHAVTNACNQLTNREPVMSLDETAVVRTLERLREKRLATLFTGAESRAAKYKHTLTDALLLTPGEVSLLCVLLLRGPQTIGELRTRTERMFAFDTLPEAEAALTTLATRQPHPLVTKLARQPGTKESRYTHLLSGPVESTPTVAAAARQESASPPVELQSQGERIAKLEQEVVELKQQFAEFRKQLE